MKTNHQVVIVAAKRTPVGNFMGSLSGFHPSELGAMAIKQAISSIPLDANEIDEVIMGQVLQGGFGQNPARQAAIKAGLKESIPSLTINHLCGSGMKSLHYAANQIALGQSDIIICGGQESMSRSGHLLHNARNGFRLGDATVRDLMLYDGLTCAINEGMHMGITAENLAEKYKISKEEQDEFALQSQLKAIKAQQSGELDKETFTVEVPQKRKDPIQFSRDEFIRADATLESIAKVRAAFKKDGSVSAANASGINDAAAVLIVTSRSKAEKLGLTPLVKIVGFASAGCDPKIMGIGPVAASKKCLDRVGWKHEEIDLIESNEAFAAQSIAVNKEMGWDTKKINQNGGAIAIGHPIGASGTRILIALINQMRTKGAKKGLATMCIGGGQGIATALELAE